ncbi:hypothetical protein ABRP91_19635 [Pectobacterium brasiliense]|uniref:glycosyltransferase family 2 protein n=1 Tax=Pectobacterium brasiliense TaxID=180957 RepID=UPI0032EAB2D0
MKITSIVIIYNSTLENSDTLRSVLASQTKNIVLDILIWNNGPSLLNEEDVQHFLASCQEKGIRAKIFQDIRNLSLSKIYNFFIEVNEFNFVTILDQDSILPKDFFIRLSTVKDADVIVPKIIAKKNDVYTQYYPHLYDNPDIIISEGHIQSPIESAMSGITISKNAVDKIITFRGYVFEEKLAFYGIDNDFFRTIKIMKDDQLSLFCLNEIHHSLSALDPEEAKNDFRIIENLYFKYFIRFEYNNKNMLSTLFICFRDLISRKLTINQTKKLISFIIRKSHPRSIEKISKNKNPSHYLKI